MHANTIETTANQQGWTLHTGFAGGQWLETSSPAGEDLIIDVPSGRPIPETVHEHAEQFDPDEHVRALDGKDADPERLDDLATLMTARLSIRDAALIAAVEPKLDTATVIDMAARPHSFNIKTLLTETLNAAFDDPHIRPDETRLARAVREACAMADRARKHGGPVAQPYALAAYLAWWDGDGKAATLAALAALDDDPETSLAIMVAAMAASGRYPAYLR